MKIANLICFIIFSYEVPPNQQIYVYSTAIRHESPGAWTYLRDKFENSDFASIKLTVLIALAHSQDPSNLKRLLKEEY